MVNGSLKYKIQYVLFNNLLKYFGTNDFYEKNVPNKREVNYNSSEDINRGNETSIVYHDQSENFFLWFKGILSINEFKNKTVLDLGSGFGGRTIYYAERGSCKECIGIDVDRAGIKEAEKYAAFKKIANVKFVFGYGEDLPFENNYFDYVLSYDVLEHVTDLEKVISEVKRVLKPGGMFCSVFPPYFGPDGHHIKRIKWPWMNVFFSTNVVYAVLKNEYGDNYKLWENNNKLLRSGLNGTTVREFNQLISHSKFNLEYKKYAPLFSKPTRLYKKINNKVYNLILQTIFKVPILLGLKEYFTHRIVFIVKK